MNYILGFIVTFISIYLFNYVNAKLLKNNDRIDILWAIVISAFSWVGLFFFIVVLIFGIFVLLAHKYIFTRYNLYKKISNFSEKFEFK
jgi:hypothetical protein